jgi:hypothetical protein
MADIGEFIGRIKYILETQTLEEAKKSIEDLGKKTETTKSITDRFVFTFGDVVNVARKVGAIFIDLITEYGKQELALTQLANAMKLQGVYTEQAYQQNVKFAESLAMITKYADEDIEEVMKLLTTFGLHDEQLRETTQAILDYSSAYGKDLFSSAMIVGRAFQGNTAGLSRMGLQIDETKSKTEQFDDMIKKLRVNLNGFAEAEAKSTLGTMASLGKSFNELKETIGGFLIPMFDRFAIALQNDFNWINKALMGVKGFIDYFRGAKEQQINYENMATSAMLGAIKKKSVGELQNEEETKRRLEILDAHQFVKNMARERKEKDIAIDTQLDILKSKRDSLNQETELYKIYADAVNSLEDERSTKIQAINNLLVSDFTSGISTMIDGSRSFSEAVGDIWEMLKAQIINAISEMIAKWLVFQAMTGIFGAGAGAIVGKIFGFQEGGIVGGAIGTPQLVLAHGGETILPTHKTSIKNFTGGGDTYNFEVTMVGSDRKLADEVSEKIFDKIRRTKKL